MLPPLLPPPPPLTHTSTNFLIINIPHQSGIFVKTQEPALIHNNHPKPLFYISVLSRCGVSYEFWQMHDDMYPSLFTLQNSFTALFTPPLLAFPGSYWSLYSLQSFVLLTMSYSWNHTENSFFSDHLLSVSNMNLSFMSFHSLIAHFFLALNNIPLYNSLKVPLFVYPFINKRAPGLLPYFGNYA